MILEGLTVSVDFADLLAETLPLNLKHFDDFVVVTSPEDRETQRIARYYGARLVLTDKFRTRWNEMHKAAGINMGLQNLKLNEWVAHLDADMVLPPQTRHLIERANLDPQKLYGCDRFVVPGHDAWRAHQAMPALQQDNYHVHLDIFPLAPRFSGARMGGYAPPGFFQLWNPGESNVRKYPEEHTTAAKTDVLHTAQWWRRSREMLPEFVAYHLETEPALQGADWGGRTTKRWGAEPDWSSHHHPRHHRPPPHHHHHHHHHPYGPGPEQS